MLLQQLGNFKIIHIAYLFSYLISTECPPFQGLIPILKRFFDLKKKKKNLIIIVPSQIPYYGYRYMNKN